MTATSYRTRWIERADALLGPRFRGRDADEVRRARLIMSTNVLLSACSFAVVALLVVFGWGASFIPSSLGSGTILAANAWMMRRTGRHDLAALTLCAVMLAAIAAASWLQGGLSNRVLTWTLLVAMFAPMLMGWRYAMISVALVIAHVVALFVAERSGHAFPELAHSSSRIVGSHILMTVFVSGFAWLWDRSRREALAARDAAQEELHRIHRELARSAHLAGKAEVATDVLHNVGNVLTALNGSANLVLERLKASKVPFLARTVALLPTSAAELGQFFATDAKGRQVRDYLGLLGETLERERAEMTAEMKAVDHQLEHVKSIVARQQAFAHTTGAVEIVHVEQLIADALQMSAVSLQRHAIDVVTEVAALPPLQLHRHKLIEILTNFIANSRHALHATASDRKRIVVRALRNDDGKLQIDVVDNGVGIAPEHLQRLFSYGFTTKRDGHGFGLAGSLLAARSIGGVARGHSDGPGAGATFTVELPFLPATTNQEQLA